MAVEVTPRDNYLGETRRQLRDGFGVYNYENKFFRYEGQWREGKKHGHGKLVMADGSYYEGSFENGEIEGHGFRYWSSTGNTYRGQFHLGELHGQGVMNYSDGAVYEGDWFRNKRQGYGSIADSMGNVYQGYFHEHKKHGEGTMTYVNGDVYEGDWVMDKRQGHGQVKFADTSIYDGQFRNDLFNGEGTMYHCSGFVYEGLWINGEPAQLATKIVLVGTEEGNTIEITQGETFALQIECRTDEGEVVEDQGRELQVIAGVRFQPPKENTPSGTSILETLEEMEEATVPTPFGFDVASYPITEQEASLVKDMESALSLQKSNTALTENTINEQDEDPEAPEGDKEVDGEAGEGGSTHVQSRPESIAPEDLGANEEVSEEALEGSPEPPRITNVKTEKGTAKWDNLYLPPAPPGYRPFLVLDGATVDGAKKSKSRASSRGDGSRPGTKSKSRMSVTPGDLVRPGDYVIAVHDVTMPPWQDKPLEPAYLLVKVKKKKKPPVGDQGKKKNSSSPH